MPNVDLKGANRGNIATPIWGTAPAAGRPGADSNAGLTRAKANTAGARSPIGFVTPPRRALSPPGTIVILNRSKAGLENCRRVAQVRSTAPGEKPPKWEWGSIGRLRVAAGYPSQLSWQVSACHPFVTAI